MAKKNKDKYKGKYDTSVNPSNLAAKDDFTSFTISNKEQVDAFVQGYMDGSGFTEELMYTKLLCQVLVYKLGGSVELSIEDFKDFDPDGVLIEDTEILDEETGLQRIYLGIASILEDNISEENEEYYNDFPVIEVEGELEEN